MHLLRVLCFVLSLTVARIDADCPYVAEIVNVEPCDKKQPNVFSLPKPYSINMVTDNCDIELSGCAKLHQDIKTAKVKWTIWQNKNQVHQGEKEACGYKLGNVEVKCPAKKGTSICAKSEVVKNPVGPLGLGMFLGPLKCKFEVSTDAGDTQCMIGLGKLRKK